MHTSRLSRLGGPISGHLTRKIALLFALSLLFGCEVFTASASAAGPYPTRLKLWVHSAPNTAPETRVGRVASGELVEVLCQDRGEVVNGSSLWDFIRYRIDGTTMTKTGYVADYYVGTGTTGTLPGVPFGNCSGAGSPPPPPLEPPPPPLEPVPPPVDRHEQQRFAIETMKLSWQEFRERKTDFMKANGCVTGPAGCRKPVPYNEYDWSDDGCSGQFEWTKRYTDQFDSACLQHDFGYRNFGKGLRFGRNEARRLWIDRRLLREMRNLCAHTYPGSSPNRVRLNVQCRFTARRVYDAVRSFGSLSFYG